MMRALAGTTFVQEFAHAGDDVADPDGAIEHRCNRRHRERLCTGSNEDRRNVLNQSLDVGVGGYWRGRFQDDDGRRFTRDEDAPDFVGCFDADRFNTNLAQFCANRRTKRPVGSDHESYWHPENRV